MKLTDKQATYLLTVLSLSLDQNIEGTTVAWDLFKLLNSTMTPSDLFPLFDQVLSRVGETKMDEAAHAAYETTVGTFNEIRNQPAGRAAGIDRRSKVRPPAWEEESYRLAKAYAAKHDITVEEYCGECPNIHCAFYPGDGAKSEG